MIRLVPKVTSRSIGQVREVPALNRAQTGLPDRSPQVAMADWHDLFYAVTEKLGSAVDEEPAAAAELHTQGLPGRNPPSVAECVAALHQLHTMLKHELSRQEHERIEARTALARSLDDLADIRADERRARHLAMHDGLTSLPNRDHFRQRLDHAFAAGASQRRALAVLYLDLDGFKTVNDTHGHDVGDELLRIMAARLTRAIRGDDLVGRLGGDEFACLLTDVPSREHLGHLACKLFDVVSAPLQIGRIRLSVLPSIGIAMCPADAAAPEALLKMADTAMYRAKRQRTGYEFFDARASADLRVGLALRSHVR